MLIDNKRIVKLLPCLIGSLFCLTATSGWAQNTARGPIKQDDEATNLRIAPYARSVLAAPIANKAGDRTGEDLYKASCGACHESGAAGAPKVGDKAAWKPRLAQGVKGLLKSATNGKNSMPPKGGTDASEAELTRAIIYMANKSGGKLK